MTIFIKLTLAMKDLPYHEIFIKPDLIATICPASPDDVDGARAWVTLPGSSFRVTESPDEIMTIIERAEAVH
jgi:hypothetical protein